MSKYHARITECEGIKFHSAKEARRYQELRLLEKAGHIARLELQRKFDLYAPNSNMRGECYEADTFTKVGTYISDFCYDELTIQATRFKVEDVKGFRTPLYRWKKRHFEAQYGVQIVEI